VFRSEGRALLKAFNKARQREACRNVNHFVLIWSDFFL